MPEKKHQKIVKKDSSNSKEAIINDVVEKAVVDIKSIFLKHTQEAYLEVANYLLENFFDSDLKKMRDWKPSQDGDDSFSKLVKRLKEDETSLPGRTWLYNSLRLLTEKRDIEGDKNLKDVVRTYEQLPVSHKIVMLPLTLEQKKDLIIEVGKENLSVRDTKQKVAELLNLTRRKGSGRVIKFNEKVLSIEKQVEEWQDQIEKALSRESGNEKEFKELSKSLGALLTKLKNYKIDDLA